MLVEVLRMAFLNHAAPLNSFSSNAHRLTGMGCWRQRRYAPIPLSLKLKLVSANLAPQRLAQLSRAGA